MKVAKVENPYSEEEFKKLFSKYKMMHMSIYV